VTDIGFERPAGFDAKGYLERAMAFVETDFSIEVWMDRAKDSLQSHFTLHRVVMEDEDGGTVMRCGREDLEAFAAMLLSLGCAIVVRKPAELREAFARLAERALQAAKNGKAERQRV
jgi:predicted DNA-binding transcriptional regulator YafY